jgi:hypothetical protein
MEDHEKSIRDKAKEILLEKGIEAALSYLCVRCGMAPIDAKKLVYELI